jgi:hypothetical protein
VSTTYDRGALGALSVCSIASSSPPSGYENIAWPHVMSRDSAFA